MNNIIEHENIKIENMIYEIRGKQVMIDSDLAKLYQVETKRINEAVKNNTDKFPERFSWKLNEEDYNELRSKFSTFDLENIIGKRKYKPRVFTEQGVAMLSTILKSNVATRVSISIMDAFVVMRKYISSNLLNSNNYSNMLINHEGRIRELENTFSNFKTFSNELFFEGQIWDAHSLLLDIFNTSNKNIIIIDNYISKELLDAICKTGKQIMVYTKNIDNNLITKYQSQYNNLTIKINNSFHDRFIIIDDIILYHCGASFKDLGKKCFAINKIEDKNILKMLKEKLKY